MLSRTGLVLMLLSSQLLLKVMNLFRKQLKCAVNVVGLLNWCSWVRSKSSNFYEKELTFQVSCSYGPGRYDSDYEVKEMIINRLCSMD